MTDKDKDTAREAAYEIVSFIRDGDGTKWPYLMKDVAAIIRKHTQPSMPEGWKLVPRKLTREMATALEEAGVTVLQELTDYWQRVYDDLLAAAPEAKVKP